ncbi:hypothetical protein BGY98DRAFT_1173048 [Russula aff. rugulosa BPL654]|nr:hypothetical protein BGY98DRAFT_1173048 [Russula aff. rugulosa BPL654]
MAKVKSDQYGLGLDITKNIYERNDYIGGRGLLNSSKNFLLGSAPSSSDSTVYPHNNTAYEPAALGASESIFVGANKKNLLCARPTDFICPCMGSVMATEIWLEQGTDLAYGMGFVVYFPPGCLNDFTGSIRAMTCMTVKIVILYESSVQIWTSVEELNNALNRDRTELVSQTVVPNRQRRCLGAGNALTAMPSSPQPLPFPSGKGPAKGQNDLVEKLVIKDRLDRMISVWRESVLKNGEAGLGCGSATTKLYPFLRALESLEMY